MYIGSERPDLEVEHCRRDEHADTLREVPEDVDEGRPDVDGLCRALGGCGAWCIGRYQLHHLEENMQTK